MNAMGSFACLCGEDEGSWRAVVAGELGEAAGHILRSGGWTGAASEGAAGRGRSSVHRTADSFKRCPLGDPLRGGDGGPARPGRLEQQDHAKDGRT